MRESARLGTNEAGREVNFEEFIIVSSGGVYVCVRGEADGAN